MRHSLRGACYPSLLAKIGAGGRSRPQETKSQIFHFSFSISHLSFGFKFEVQQIVASRFAL
jgi:hypothetical protein